VIYTGNGNDGTWFTSDDTNSVTSAKGMVYFFTGRELDRLHTGLKLYNYRARTYDPLLGRFLQRDPAEYIDSMNLYEYVKSNPLNDLDPTGQFAALALAESGGLGAYAAYVELINGILLVATVVGLDSALDMVFDPIAAGIANPIGSIQNMAAAFFGSLAFSNEGLWHGRTIPQWLADKLKIDRHKLGDIVEKLKKAAQLGPADNVYVDPSNGEVYDQNGESIGNVHDEYGSGSLVH